MNGLSDQQLLREYAERRSEAAFAELVRRHIDLIYSAALRMVGDRHLAEDVTQGTFVALARSAPHLTECAVLSGWLHRTAQNIAAQTVRTEVRRRAREHEAAAMNELFASEPDGVWEFVAPHLDSALRTLSEGDRDALLLRYFERKSAQEMAEVLGVSGEAAQKRVSRAVERLRESFAKRGVTVAASGLAVVLSANAVQAAPAGLAAVVTMAANATGAIAGASIPTFIPKTFTLMASTKLKPALSLIALLLLAAGTGMVFLHAIPGRPAASPLDLQGTWEGLHELPGIVGLAKGEKARTRIVVTFFKTNGAYRAAAEFIDTKQHLEFAGMSYNPPFVRIDVKPDVSYEGTLNAPGTEISGVVKSQNFSFPMRLARTAAPTVAPAPLTESDSTPRAGSALQGRWNGTLGNGADAVHVVVRIAESSSGIFRAEMDNITGSWPDQPMSVSYHRPEVKLLVTSRAGMFEGTINPDASEMVGDWVQGGRHAPAIFRRAD